MPSVGQNLQPFTGNGVKNSRVGRKTLSKQINKRLMGHIAHLMNPVQINQHIWMKLWLYHNVEQERKKTITPIFEGVGLYLNKLESPLPKNALCQVWLKLSQWLWKRRQKCEKFTNRQTDGQITYNLLSEKLTWAFISGELKMFCPVYLSVLTISFETNQCFHKNWVLSEPVSMDMCISCCICPLGPALEKEKTNPRYRENLWGSSNDVINIHLLWAY